MPRHRKAPPRVSTGSANAEKDIVARLLGAKVGSLSGGDFWGEAMSKKRRRFGCFLFFFLALVFFRINCLNACFETFFLRVLQECLRSLKVSQVCVFSGS